MRIVYMGTSSFAVPALELLLENSEEIPLVVTPPDKPKGRGKKMDSSPVKLKALEYQLEIEQPERIKDNEEFIKLLRTIAPDLIVVASYGKILPAEIIEIPTKGCVNIHASLLPRFRGAAPIQRAILEGDLETGVTLMYMSEGLDQGNIIAKSKTLIKSKSAHELHDELAYMGANLLLDSLAEIGNDSGIEQDNSKATYARMITREEGHLNFNKNPDYIERLSRALEGWPGIYAYYQGQKIKLFGIRVACVQREFLPGSIIHASDKGLEIAAGNGKIIVEEIQFPGKRRMPAGDFLKGNEIKLGEVLK